MKKLIAWLLVLAQLPLFTIKNRSFDQNTYFKKAIPGDETGYR